MARMESEDLIEIDDSPVGPFTGFGNFFRKEIIDWLKSWRLIIVFAIPMTIQTLSVVFAYEQTVDQMEKIAERSGETVPRDLIATSIALGVFQIPKNAILIFVVIFSTMGLLTTEKSTGTLAWNLTKPLGRTGLITAKWLAATLMLWWAMALLPTFFSIRLLRLIYHVHPDVGLTVPVIGISIAWIGLYVLVVLTISLGFQSQAAVGGIAIAFWLVPTILGALMGQVLGEENRSWVLDRLATNSPFWAYSIAADQKLQLSPRDKEWKEVWLYTFAVWTAILSLFTFRTFNRQEIGS